MLSGWWQVAGGAVGGFHPGALSRLLSRPVQPGHAFGCGVTTRPCGLGPVLRGYFSLCPGRFISLDIVCTHRTPRLDRPLDVLCTRRSLRLDGPLDVLCTRRSLHLDGPLDFLCSRRSLCLDGPLDVLCTCRSPRLDGPLDIVCTRHSPRLDGVLPLGKRPRRPLCCDVTHRSLDRRRCPVSLSLRPSGFAPRIK